jgi:c(7)-type cytochrome triheme protein
MEPVTYDKNCAACHTLPFDRRSAESVPHETPEGVHSFVLERLKSYLEQHPTAWRDPEPGRRIPGVEPLTRARNAGDWLQAQVGEDESLLWRKTCKQCHTLDSGPNAVGTQSALPRVRAAVFTSRWFTHALFDHSAHAAVTCESCHSATLSSKETSDVLIPGIKTCQSCHSGSKAESAESGCALCHQYHDWKQRKAFKPMYTIPQITGQGD